MVVLLTAIILLADGSSQSATWAKPSMEACEQDKAGLLEWAATTGAQAVVTCWEEPIRAIVGEGGAE